MQISGHRTLPLPGECLTYVCTRLQDIAAGCTQSERCQRLKVVHVEEIRHHSNRAFGYILRRGLFSKQLHHFVYVSTLHVGYTRQVRYVDGKAATWGGRRIHARLRRCRARHEPCQAIPGRRLPGLSPVGFDHAFAGSSPRASFACTESVRNEDAAGEAWWAGLAPLGRIHHGWVCRVVYLWCIFPIFGCFADILSQGL